MYCTPNAQLHLPLKYALHCWTQPKELEKLRALDEIRRG
jgi:hypothetical protein